MKRFDIKALLLTSILPVLMVLLVTCKKSETNTNSPSPDITAVAHDDHIELSWNSFGNADYYVITDDFCIVDENNHQTDSTYNVLITETSQNNYVDLHPFAGMNHYKVTAVNENGIYLAHVNTDEGELVKRFVVAHD